MTINFKLNEDSIQAMITVNKDPQLKKYSVRLSFWGRPVSEQAIQALMLELKIKNDIQNLTFDGKSRVALSEKVQYERIEFNYELSDVIEKMDRLTSHFGLRLSI